MSNAQIADVFDQVAELLEFQGANQFRVRAYRNAARTIRDYPEPIAVLAGEGAAKVCELPGIGEDLAKKCCTLVETGQLPQLVELQAQVPASVLALLRIPGLGPKKAAALHKELGIQSLEELKTACEAGRVRVLKGFGEKTERTILAGIGAAAAAGMRILWAEADEIARDVALHMRGTPGIRELEFGGSYRRGRDTVGDLDLLVVADDPGAIMDRFGAYPRVKEVIARGDTKMSVRLDTGLQLDLRTVPEASFGAALQYFTGSKDHNVVVRGRAKARGMKINEYGLYRVEGETETYLVGRTEKEIYEALGLPLFPPELREARQEFDWAEAGALPKLIEEKDIRGDLHMHTRASDGRASLQEMVAAARQRGLKYIAITDHSKRVTMANGLDGARLREQWKEIDRMNQDLGDDFHILKGVECDILEKGGMDLPDDVLAEADWVLASVHYGQQQPQEQITARLLEAIEHPSVTAIAHPTGRLLGRREPYAIDLEAVMKGAAKHGKFLELNANPPRLDLNDVACAAAKKHGIPIVIDTDAHSTDQLAYMRYGILQARRAGLTKDDVVNTRTWPQLKKMLRRA